MQVGVSKRTIERAMSSLQKKGVFVRVGLKRDRVWKEGNVFCIQLSRQRMLSFGCHRLDFLPSLIAYRCSRTVTVKLAVILSLMGMVSPLGIIVVTTYKCTSSVPFPILFVRPDRNTYDSLCIRLVPQTCVVSLFLSVHRLGSEDPRPFFAHGFPFSSISHMYSMGTLRSFQSQATQ